jgi:hypothetical protein
MSDNWNIPAGDNNLGMQYLVYLGFDKSKIAPASAIGGGAIFRGVDSLGQCHNGDLTNDVYRGGNRSDGGNNEADFLAHGGVRIFSSTYGVSWIRGTSNTATWSDWKVALGNGEKFLWMANDSTAMYAKTTWLLENGWGGICPYSVSEDNVYTAPKSSRLKSHRGIVAAIAAAGGEPPAEPSTRGHRLLRKR